MDKKNGLRLPEEHKGKTGRKVLEVDPKLERMVDQLAEKSERSKKKVASSVVVAGLLALGIRVPKTLQQKFLRKAAV